VWRTGDHLQLWLSEDRSEIPALGALAGEEVVFMVALTYGQAYPEGYSLYASDSFWTVSDGRVTGGLVGIRLEDAPYDQLAQHVRDAMGSGTPEPTAASPVPVAAAALAVCLAVWALWRLILRRYPRT